ncbi:MAG TPA: thiamine pyrophosphate-dependent enzyme, partial [Longimicrobiales bacterium]
PGDGVNGIIEAFRKRKDRIRFIQTRHEEAAAFMACAYAKFTGRLGCCVATSGPGGIHLLNGLYDAAMDGQPVLAITGMQYHDLTHTFQQQDVRLDHVFEDVSKYNVRIMGPAHVEPATDLACRTALAYRGVASITIPVDFQEMEVKERSKRNVAGHESTHYARSSRLPSEDELRRAAQILNEGKRIVILAGQGALGARDQLLATAERLGAVIVKPLLGKATVPDDSPYTTGGIGLLGTTPSQEALEACDTLLIVGSSFPYIEFYPKPGQARAIQVELDPMRIGLRYPVECGLIGDSARTLAELLPLLQPHEDRSFLEKAQQGMGEWRKIMDMRAQRDDSPMKPQRFAMEIGKRLADDAIVSCDSGTIATWWARHIPARGNQMHTISGNLATMACGLPYTIAAQVAYPNRQCVGFVGDGGISMLMAEIATAVKYQLPVKIFINKNNTLGQIKWEQMVFLGNPEYVVDLQPIDFALVANACGATGYTIEDPADCGRIVEEALHTPGPVVVEGVVDPFEPPLPPRISVDQAIKFAESLARGEPDRGAIMLNVAKERIREMI